jgi:hypothetical protein
MQMECTDLQRPSLLTRKPDVDAAAIDALLQKVFGTSTPVTYERTPDGVSTQVYRLVRGSETFYLRIAEEADENLETDAELHQRLRDLGVKVALLGLRQLCRWLGPPRGHPLDHPAVTHRARRINQLVAQP